MQLRTTLSFQYGTLLLHTVLNIRSPHDVINVSINTINHTNNNTENILSEFIFKKLNNKKALERAKLGLIYEYSCMSFDTCTDG